MAGPFRSEQVVNGQLIIADGPLGLSHNRLLPATATVYSSTTNSAQWPAGAQPTSLLISALPATSVTYPVGSLLGYAVVNAPNDATAASWLSQAGDESVDVQYYPILMGIPLSIKEDAPITRCDVLPTIASLPIFIGGN